MRVFDEEDAAWVRARGGEAVLYSGAAADSLMAWFEAWNPALEEGWRARSSHQRKV